MTDSFFRDASDAGLARMAGLGLGRGGFRSRWGGNATLTDLKAWRDAGASSSLLAAGSPRPQSCAVVGASSSLLRATDGPAIDAADFVIRINNAPLPAAFRAQLGTRTSLLITTFPDVRPHSLPHELHSHAPLLLDAYDFHEAPVLFYCHVPYISRCWTNIRHDRRDRFSPAFIEHVRSAELKTSKWPSTGAMAVAFARRACISVRLYGFGGISGGQYQCAKYYGAIGIPGRPTAPLRFVVPATHRDKCATLRKYASPNDWWHDWYAKLRTTAATVSLTIYLHEHTVDERWARRPSGCSLCERARRLVSRWLAGRVRHIGSNQMLLLLSSR